MFDQCLAVLCHPCFVPYVFAGLICKLQVVVLCGLDSQFRNDQQIMGPSNRSGSLLNRRGYKSDAS